MHSIQFVGHTDAIENGEVYGWALNVKAPTDPVIVSLYLDGKHAADAIAGYYRPDVAQALSCSGRNGFYFDLDSFCQGDKTVRVEIRFPDFTLICGGPLSYYRYSNYEEQNLSSTVLFLHIPKTAGTAFREVVARNYKQSQMAYIYGDPPGFPSTCLRDIPISQRARLRMVFGHYGYGVHCDMPNECHYATLLRPPLLRIWSHYLHLARDRAAEVMNSGRLMSISELMEKRQCLHLDNLYVRYFCGIEESELSIGSINQHLYKLALNNALSPNVHIGFQDNLDLAYDSLATDLGWIPGLKSPRVNFSPTPELSPSAEEIQAIEHFNSWDFKIYKEITRQKETPLRN